MKFLTALFAVGFILVITLPTFAAAQTYLGGISAFNGSVISAGSNTVIFVYPDTSGTKPTGTFAAQFTDWTAIGILIGVTDNPQLQTFDTNTGTPIFMNTATGQPGVSSKVITTVGGPLVHSIVHWLEVSTSFGGAEISPVYFSATSTDLQFIVRTTGLPCSGCTQAKTAPTSQDLFVIYSVTDSNGNVYFVFYGFHYRGSLAASNKLLQFVQSSTLSSQTFSYEVWQWVDATTGPSANGIPDAGDTYTLMSEA